MQRVVSPTTRQESWTVLGDDDAPIGPIERYLTYLTDIERSPNTVRAYAHDLEGYFSFLVQHGLDWREVRLEDLGQFRGLAASATADARQQHRGAALGRSPPGGGAVRGAVLHHVSVGGPVARRTIEMKAAKKLPRVLTAAEAQSILDTCTRLRDRFLFAVLHESGVRIGEALGLRHEDIAVAERELAVVPRVNDNGARPSPA